MNLADVLPQLKSLKKNGDGYTAKCPAHDDAKNSLSAAESSNGKLLLKCHAGCAFESIVSNFNKPATTETKSKIVATFDYRDERGQLLYQNVKFEPKDFRQRKPDASEQSGWNWKLNGTRRVPYRLPELIKAIEEKPERFVLLTEGEKDADNLRALGFAASSFKNWKAGFSEFVKTAYVALLTDHDRAGIKQANDAALLLSGNVTALKIVDLYKDEPLPEKHGKDVSDWLNEGHDAEELRGIIKTSPRFAAADDRRDLPPTDSDDDAPKFFELSDKGNGERLADQHGNELRFCQTWEKWLVWNGTRWQIDMTNEVMRKAKRCVETIRHENNRDSKALLKFALASQSRSGLNATIELAKSEMPIPATDDQFDSDGLLFNCANGTLNLKTGELLPSNPGDYITKQSPIAYDPTAECPTWLAFLNKVQGGNQENIEFLRRYIGYCLTAFIHERSVFILYGMGRNGKSTFTDTIQYILGDYAMRTPTDTLVAKKGMSGGVPNDIARLRGARFIYCSETEDGQRINESLIKDLSGGEMMTARFMRSEFFEFKMSGKITLTTNHKPKIKGTDAAIWDRVKLIPFTVRITDDELDPDLSDKLKAEAPGILRWALKGCIEWQNVGLRVPQDVLDATQSYKDEMDVLGKFMDENCAITANAEIARPALYKLYRDWTETAGLYTQSEIDFNAKIRERGFDDSKRKRMRPSENPVYFWQGIGQRLEQEADF